MSWLRALSRLQNLSITQRISATLVLALVFVAVVSGVLTIGNFLQWNLSGYILDQRAFEVIAGAVSRTADGHLAIVETPALLALERDAPTLWFAVRDPGGEQIARGVTSAACVSVVSRLPRIFVADVTDVSERGNLSCKLRTIRGNLGLIQIAYGGGPLVPAWKGIGVMVLDYLEMPFFVPLLLLNVLTIPLVVALALRRVKDIAQLARYVDIERSGLRLPEAGLPGEVAPLVRAFNAALARVDAGRTQQERFIADAAHELRTPVAIIQARLDTMEDSPLKLKLEQDVERLGELTDSLLDLQSIKSIAPQMTSLDLVALVSDTLAELAPVVVGKGHEIEFICQIERIDITADPVALRRLIVNLVQNAIKHGGEAVMIAVEIEANTTHAMMEFVDTGPGIPPAWRDQIFESFSRYSRSTPGAGLGLAIVREIALMHGGRASYFEPRTRGTGIRVLLPHYLGTKQEEPIAEALR
jgi:two-component system, OmpR family, sensor histidine kinase TctE